MSSFLYCLYLDIRIPVYFVRIVPEDNKQASNYTITRQLLISRYNSLTLNIITSYILFIPDVKTVGDLKWLIRFHLISKFPFGGHFVKIE